MENAGDVDQFASLIPNCQPTSSQEDKLRSCPFVRASEEFSGMDSYSSEDEASEQPTGILMLTMAESSDDYQTPPEQHFYSQNSSNDGQVPTAKAAVVDREKESGGVQDGELVVANDGYDRKGEEMVNLANDSDNLGLLEKGPTVLPEDTDKVSEDDYTLMIDVDDLIGSETMANETDAENSTTNAPETPPKERADKVFVEMPMREPEASMSDTEVSSNMAANRKRKLPFSTNRPRKNDTDEDGDPSDYNFIDILNLALKILRRDVHDGDDGDKDVDFLETAKRRGMTFPRPRWWPPEGDIEFKDSNF